MNIWSDFLSNDGRMINKWSSYFPVYERHMSRFRNQATTMLEIGCGNGGSLQMWRRFLGPHARIIGVDIEPAAKRYEEHQIEVRIGDQGDDEFLLSLVEEFGAFDIVLDDGSHLASHMVSTFKCLYPRIAANGLYMVEDLQANYSSKFEGGYLREGTFIELCKSFVDGLNGFGVAKVPSDPMVHVTLSMHVYEKIVAFERGRHEPAKALRTMGGASGSSEPPS